MSSKKPIDVSKEQVNNVLGKDINDLRENAASFSGLIDMLQRSMSGDISLTTLQSSDILSKLKHWRFYR